MKKILFKHIVSVYILFIPSEFVLPNNLEIDSLSNISALSSDSIGNFTLDFDLLSDLEMSRLFFNEIHNTTLIEMRQILLSKQQFRDYVFQSILSEQRQINERLTSYLKFRNDSALKSDLGAFGKILGNAKNITAIILAILHVIKYKKGMY